jgi:hypothetical protein
VPYTSKYSHILAFLIPAVVLLGMVGKTCASEGNSTQSVLTQDALNKMMGALGDIRAKNLPVKIGGGDLDADIANLQKQPKIESILKKRGLSTREFVLTYKAAAQIEEAEKARDNWQKILQDPSASPQAKLDATQKLGDSLKNNLFTPEQIELVRHKMPDLETLLAPPK